MGTTPFETCKGFVFDFALEAISKKLQQLAYELSGQVSRAAQQSGAQELKTFAAQQLRSSAAQHLSISAAQELSSSAAQKPSSSAGQQLS